MEEKITVNRKKAKKLTVNRKSHYPIETLSKSVLINPPASANAVAGPREHAVIDCVAIFYEEEKSGENYRKKESNSDVR